MKLRHTFEGFVVGPGNRRAYLSCLAVANDPRRAGKPLFIHGPAGLGKTHLMRSVEQRVLQDQPNLRVAHLGAEKFAAEYRVAECAGALEGFRRRYGQLNLLLLDDIQFLSDAPTAHALHELLEPGNPQVVLTSDRAMVNIAIGWPLPTARLHQCITASIRPLGYATRLAILRAKAAALSLRLTEPVLQRVARRLPGSVGRLEGAMFRVAGMAEQNGASLHISAVDALLRELFPRKTNRESANLAIYARSKLKQL
jgi:chromosomal replication initiator protein